MLERKLAGVNSVSTTRGEAFAEDIFVDVRFPGWFKTSFLDLREYLLVARRASIQGLMLCVSHGIVGERVFLRAA